MTTALMGKHCGLAEPSRGLSQGFQEGFLEEIEPMRGLKDVGSWLCGQKELCAQAGV